MELFFKITPFFEVAIIAFMLNFLLSFFWNTKSMDLVVGLFAFLVVLGISSWLNLPVLHRIMVLTGEVAFTAILIIFHPEIRLAFSKLSVRGRRYREMSELDRFLDQLGTSVYRMSERGIGALIALEKEDSLQEYCAKGISLQANFTSELIETLFAPNTPLHDGAVLIRNQTILAAGVILPLAEDASQVGRSTGTRHRAGLGLSQVTDAVVIVVSEETGRVSIAREGVMTPGIKIDRFKGILRSIFATATIEAPAPRRFPILNWLRT